MIDTNKIYITIRNEKAYIDSRLSLIANKSHMTTLLNAFGKLFVFCRKQRYEFHFSYGLKEIGILHDNNK